MPDSVLSKAMRYWAISGGLSTVKDWPTGWIVGVRKAHGIYFHFAGMEMVRSLSQVSTSLCDRECIEIKK